LEDLIENIYATSATEGVHWQMVDAACDTNESIQKVDTTCDTKDILQMIDVNCDTEDLAAQDTEDMKSSIQLMEEIFIKY
jgi:hypothetical protein